MQTEAPLLPQLLPAYIRSRDHRAAKQLDALLTIVGGQAAALEADLQRMYDGWFIETCDEWLIPYIADLIGLEPAHLALGEDAERNHRLAQVLSMRSATANAIAHRRRKGTVWILEELARDVAHWPARAMEFHRQIVVASHLDHLQPGRAAMADLRSARTLGLLNTPHDEFCHLADVRRISHAMSPGLYGVDNVGLFVWPLRAYSVTRTAAYCREDAGRHCFTFSALGHDTQLSRAPIPESKRTSLARVEHVPGPITRLMLERDAAADATKAQADPALYGPAASVFVECPDWPARGRKGSTTEEQPLITSDRVIPADLSNWSYKVPAGYVAVDPVFGRIAFPSAQPPRREVKVTYRYGFAADIGGGEYSRAAASLPPEFDRVPVWPEAQPGTKKVVTIASAFAAWRKRNSRPGSSKGASKSSDVATTDSRPPERALVIELMTSGVYEGRFTLALEKNETVAIVAAPGTRPVLWLSDESAGSTDSIVIRGRRGSRAILDGLLIAGRGVEIGDAVVEAQGKDQPHATDEPSETVPESAGLCDVWIRHTTIVPGHALTPTCDPRSPSEPSLVVDRTSSRVRIEASIVGAIRVLHDGPSREPTPLSIIDSIVDATSDERVAIGGIGGELAYAELNVQRSTIVGGVVVHAIRLAEDSIFVSKVIVARRQIGCMRFSYVSPASRTPKRYGCEPDGAIEQAVRDVERLQMPDLSRGERTGLAALRKAQAQEFVAPRFTSVRYGSPTYLRLTDCVHDRISRGAHDESEMGVYHDLFEPQRRSLLSDRLAEFVPAGCDAAVVFVT